MDEILQKLQGGDLRSIGRTNEVVKDILNDPELFPMVFDGIFSHDPRIRMRAADAIEKVSRQRPEYLQPFKEKLINYVSKIEQQEVRWHVAQMFSYLRLEASETEAVVGILLEHLKDKSKIVQTFSMQTLADIAERDQRYRPRVISVLNDLTESGSAAVKARGRTLLKRLTGPGRLTPPADAREGLRRR